MRAVGGNLHHKPILSKLAHQRGIFAHGVKDDNTVIGGKKHIHKFPFSAEALAAPRNAEVQPVRVFQLLAVCHDDIMGKGVQAVIDGLAVHAELLRHKRNENRRGAGCHATLYLNPVVAEGQTGHKALLLLEVQPLQKAVVLLHDTRYCEQVVVQLSAGGGGIYHKEGQKKHSLVAALQIIQQVLGVLTESNEVRGKNVHVVTASDGLFLFFHLHFVNVADFSFDSFDGLSLIDGLNVHGNGHFSVYLQQLGKELVGKFGGHNLHIGGRSPGGAHAKQPGLAEVKAGRGNKIFRPHSGLGYHIPCEAEGLCAAGVKLTVKYL